MKRKTMIEAGSAFHQIILKNIQVLGNCLGSTKNINNALDDYKNGKYTMEIDSIFDTSTITEFLKKSFVDKNRFGKIICKFN